MNATNIGLLLIGGLVTAGVVAVYRFTVGKKVRRATATAEEARQKENSEASAEAMEMLIEEEDED